MNAEQILNLEQLAAAATPGPWVAYPDTPGDNEDRGPFPLIGVATAPGINYIADQWGQPLEHSNYGWDFICSTAHDPDSTTDDEIKNFESNAEFIAAARQAVPELIAEVRKLQTPVTDAQLASLVSEASSCLDEIRGEEDAATISLAVRCDYIQRCIDALLARQRAAESPQWVLVSERLPEQKASYNPVSWAVLAMEYTGSMVLVAYDHFKEQWVGLDYTPRITHWMPLPKAPTAKVEGSQSK